MLLMNVYFTPTYIRRVKPKTENIPWFHDFLKTGSSLKVIAFILESSAVFNIYDQNHKVVMWKLTISDINIKHKAFTFFYMVKRYIKLKHDWITSVYIHSYFINSLGITSFGFCKSWCAPISLNLPWSCSRAPPQKKNNFLRHK